MVFPDQQDDEDMAQERFEGVDLAERWGVVIHGGPTS